jgi:cadmium resistance protein CadD (predicted permease)
MKSNLAALLKTTGAIIISCSIIRWFFIFYDPSQMILGIGIGIIVYGFGYIYNWIRQKDEEDKKRDKRLDDFTKWLTIKELQ